MAVPVYSTQFIIARHGTPEAYTVDDSHLAVIRCMTCFNSSIFVTQYAQLVDDATGATLLQATLQPNDGFSPTSIVFDTRIVIDPLGVFTAFPGSDVDITVSGYLLALP